MNKTELLEILAPEIIFKNILTNLTQKIGTVTTNLQSSEPDDVVFYKVQKDEKSIAEFKKRVAGKSPGLIIMTLGSENYIKNDNCVFVAKDRFMITQKLLMDEMFPNKNTMKIIGVTGTNGKTTTVNLAMQISTMIKFPAISVGTIGVHNANEALINNLESTTPSYVEFRKIINRFQDKYYACFVEISSHALEQERLYDILLDGAAWTSFSQDHLDYHKTMDDYFHSKLKLEKNLLKGGRKLLLPSAEKELYKKIMKANPEARIKLARTFSERKIDDKPLFYHSSYNQNNTELALQLNADLWGEDKVERIKLKYIKTPPGRFSVIQLEHESMAIVDYAHTPDALINIGEAIKKAFPTHSLTVVFGCGGDRDKSKRPLMGKAVAAFANKIIVTSDNPRSEEPDDIISDISTGINGRYEAIPDRKEAILYALESLRKKEIVLIAGKGHEEYQEIRGVKRPFSDMNIVLNFKRG